MAIPTGKRVYTKSSPTLLEFATLCAIRHSGEDFVDIPTVSNVLRRRAQLEPPPTTLYTILRRLEQDDLVFRTDDNSRPRGESRVYYSITEAGDVYLTTWLGKITAIS